MVGACVQRRAGGNDSGDRIQLCSGRSDTYVHLFKKFAGDDDQMDAGEFADALKAIIGEGALCL